MVRAPRYGYQQGYASWQRQPLWQEGERIDKWNPYYRQDLTGEDEEISLEDVEGGKPPTYVPQIDRQALGYKDVLGPRNHPWQALSETLPPAAGYGDIYDQMGETNRRNRGVGGLIRRVNPFDNAQPPATVPAPAPEPTYFEGNMPRPRPLNALEALREQQERDSKFRVRSVPMRDVGFSPTGDVLPPGPPPGPQSWNETPQETIGTHGGPTDLIAPPDKPQQDTQSVAAVFGSPQSGATAMAEDPRQKAARIAREAFGRDPSLIKEFMPKLQAVGVDPALGAPEGWSLPDTGTLTADDMATPFMSSRPVGGQAQPLPPEPTDPWAAADADWRDWERRRDTNMVRPEGPPGGLPGQQQTQGIADIFSGGGAGPPPPGLPRPRPMDSLIAGRPDAPLGGMPTAPQFAGNMPQPRPEPQFAGNMPRPRPEDAGMATARLPQPRPDMPGDVAALSPDQRLAPFAGPAPPVSPELAAAAGRATRPTDPFLTELPSLGAIDQTVQRAPAPSAPIDPAAIAEARRTLQLHPDTGRIRTAPGFTQFNEPARTRPLPAQAEAPLIRPDLTQAAADYPSSRLPRARPTPPPIEAMGSDLPEAPPIPGAGSLPSSVMENIARAGYDPTASGGPAVPASPEEELARKTLIKKLGQPPETVPGYADPVEGLIAGPEVGAINQGQPLPPPQEATVPSLPPITEQQTIDDRPPLIAPPAATTPINPRLSPKEIEKRARTRGFGTVENLTGDRWARGIGAATGVAAGLATGNPLLATTLGVQGYKRGDDVRRSYMNRSGIFGIFGGPRSKDKNKNKDKDTIGTPPSHEPAGVKEAAAAASRSGLGSDRGGFLGGGGMGYGGGYYGGGSYPGYSGYGGGYGPDSVGGAYTNR